MPGNQLNVRVCVSVWFCLFVFVYVCVCECVFLCVRVSAVIKVLISFSNGERLVSSTSRLLILCSSQHVKHCLLV